jgi:hypothetical protein
MARSGGILSDDLLGIAKKSFVGGCFGCLGVGTTALAVFLIVVVVFPAQFAAIVKTIPLPVFPQVGPIVTATAPVTHLPSIDIWISADDQCTPSRITQLKLPVQQPLFVCVQNPEGVSVHFTVQITPPSGRVMPLGADLMTNPDGKPFSIGIWSEPPSVPGVYRIDAIVGTTIVGSTVLTVSS